MKQCKNCSTEFEPKHETRGHEQLYCSIKCRTESYKKRVMNKIHENENKETQEQSRISGVDLQRTEHRINPMGNYIPNVNLEILEGKYQAKTEALEYKLRYEGLVKELEDAKRKIMELEKKYGSHDEKIKKIFATLNLLLMDEDPSASGKSKKEIGFKPK